MKTSNGERLLTICVCATILLLTFIGCTKEESSKNISTMDPGVTAPSVYQYRMLSAQFDSVALSCMYGESFVTNGETRLLEYEHWNAYPGLDSTSDHLYSLSRTKAVRVTPTSTFSIWRGLTMSSNDRPYNIPERCAWIMSLHDARTGNRIAVLDSCGYFEGKGKDNKVFPNTFGMKNNRGNSYDQLTFRMNDLVPKEIDSVFITYRVQAFRSANKSIYKIYDDEGRGGKFSESFAFNNVESK